MVLNYKTCVLHDIFHGCNCQLIMQIEIVLDEARSDGN